LKKKSDAIRVRLGAKRSKGGSPCEYFNAAGEATHGADFIGFLQRISDSGHYGQSINNTLPKKRREPLFLLLPPLTFLKSTFPSSINRHNGLHPVRQS
jgi:hypothetical protein